MPSTYPPPDRAALIIVLIGRPGSGKSTQARILARALGTVSFATGTALVRTADADLRARLDRGALAPHAEVRRVVAGHLAATATALPVILDGYPRSDEQLMGLADLSDQHGRSVVGIVIAVGIEDAMSRIAGRARTAGRAMDVPDVVGHRLDVFAAQTAPMIEVMRSGPWPVRIIDGSWSEDVVAHAVVRVPEIAEAIRAVRSAPCSRPIPPGVSARRAATQPWPAPASPPGPVGLRPGVYQSSPTTTH